MTFNANTRIACGRVRRFTMSALLLPGALLLGMTSTSAAQGGPCEVADAGGTVVLPPIGCDYLSPDEVHVIIDGLPPGTTLELKPIHKDFICQPAFGGPPPRPSASTS